MKAIIKLAVISATMIAASMASAQTDTNTVPTNSLSVVQNVNYALTFYEQKSLDQTTGNAVVAKSRFTTADLIQALGTATGNTFSRSAKLVTVSGAGSPIRFITFEVRDKANTVDVSSYFSWAVTNEVYNIKTSSSGKQSGQIYEVESFMINTNSALTLDVGGFVTEQVSTVGYKGSSYIVHTYSANVAGSAVYNGTPAIVTGKISVSGRKFE